MVAFRGVVLSIAVALSMAKERPLISKRNAGSVRYDPATHVAVRSSGCGKTSPYKVGTTTAATGTYSGVKRTFLVYVPASYDSNTPVPLVVAHHGWTGSASGEENGDGLKSQASSHGFISVYPQGMGDNTHSGSWASWNCVGSTESPGPAGATCTTSNPNYCYTSCNGCGDNPQCWWTTCDDDVTASGSGKTGVTGFIPSLYDTLESQLCIDTSREYAAGFSNGGMMTFQLGASMGTRLAAIVPIAGSFHYGFNEIPAVGVAVLATHGFSDTTVPANGTPPLGGGWYYTNMAEIFGGNKYSAGWKSSNGCSGSSSHFVTPYDGQNSLYCVSEGVCSGGDVVRCAFTGGHTYAPSNGALIWWFASQFTKPTHIGGGQTVGESLMNTSTLLRNLEFYTHESSTSVDLSSNNGSDALKPKGKHYGDPRRGCLHDEDEIPVAGDGFFVGSVCAPRINSTTSSDVSVPTPDCKLGGNSPFENGCPKDAPTPKKKGAWPTCLDKGKTSTPYINGEFHCLLVCGPCNIQNSSLDCGDDAHSQCPGRSKCILGELRQVSLGVCAYPKHNSDSDASLVV